MNTALVVTVTVLAVALIATLALLVRTKLTHEEELIQENARGWNTGREYQLGIMAQPRQRNGRFRSKRVSAIVGTGGR